MRLNFTNEYYRNKAMQLSENKKVVTHSIQDAFFILIKDIELECLSNLCIMIQEYFKSYNLSIENCYQLTQGNDNSKIKLDDKIKIIILKLAYNCIESGKYLGDQIIPESNINASSWISHSMFEGKLAGQLAMMYKLDSQQAVIQGLLHDYGRKKIHDFMHVIIGFENLVDLGWEAEAIACLTHSFLNGGRCATNDQALDGFFIDSYGNPKWKEGTIKDDITIFLEKYKFTKYDIILNISDLMAKSNGIVSPYERIKDIESRRILDRNNRVYFLSEFSNVLINFLKDININLPKEFEKEIKPTQDLSLDDITKKFKKISDLFFEIYSSFYPIN